MNLTSMEINNKDFKKGIRGYSVEEVDEFLCKVADDYEEIYRENVMLKQKIESMNEKIEQYSKIENTIQNTLLLAQNTAEQSKATAQKESELIIKSANDTAQKILDKAHADVVQVNDEYDKIKQEFIKFRAKYRSFISTQMDTFSELERDFVKDFHVTSANDIENIENKAIEVVDDNKDAEIKKFEDSEVTESIDEIKSFFAKK